MLRMPSCITAVDLIRIPSWWISQTDLKCFPSTRSHKVFDKFSRFPVWTASYQGWKRFQDELIHSQTCWCQGSLGSVSDLEPHPHPTEGEEGWVPCTRSKKREREITDPILALVLAAFSGTNHFFTADHSSVWKKLSLFWCLLEMKRNVWGFYCTSYREVLWQC